MNASKRFVDVTVALVAIILTLPLLLIAAILIWLEDRGPVLFLQKRLGHNGRVFTIYKFRKFSATHGNEGPNVTLHDDARYSKVGKFLEKTKLNELPQLFNVLKGEMSFVGPRPEILEYTHCYTGSATDLLKFTPGIFGPSQTMFRNEAKMYPKGCNPDEFYADYLFPQKAEIDIKYYSGATLTSDMYWIYRSLKAVVTPEPISTDTIREIPPVQLSKGPTIIRTNTH